MTEYKILITDDHGDFDEDEYNPKETFETLHELLAFISSEDCPYGTLDWDKAEIVEYEEVPEECECCGRETGMELKEVSRL